MVVCKNTYRMTVFALNIYFGKAIIALLFAAKPGVTCLSGQS